MTERFKMAAVVPVVVLDDAKDAVATANALLAGGVDVMEITFRTVPTWTICPMQSLPGQQRAPMCLRS